MSAEKWLAVLGLAGFAALWFAVRLAEANHRIDSVLAQFNDEHPRAEAIEPGDTAPAAPAA